MGKLGDIDPSRCDVGGDKHADVAFFKSIECFGAGTLAFIAVDRAGLDPRLFELFTKFVGPVFGAGEDEDLFPVSIFDEFGGDGCFCPLVTAVGTLGNGFSGGFFRADLDGHRVNEKFAGHVADFFGKSRREQKVLPFSGQHFNHLADVVDKSHIKHAVGFVEDEDFHFVEFTSTLTAEIEQSARSGDEDIHAVFELPQLRANLYTTKDDHTSEVEVFPVSFDTILHLGGKFAGRGDNKRTDRTTSNRAPWAGFFEDL